MWEVRVQHDGLKAYRVVRGATQQEAELKARLQVAAWNERWSNKEAALKSKMQKLQKSWNNEENKQTARTRTEELQGQMNALEVILADGLQRRPLQWQNLKDQTVFTTPCPLEPVAPSKPTEPDPSLFKAQLGFFDRVFKSRRSRKEAVAAAEFETEMTKWRSACAQADEAHRSSLLVHTTKMVEWAQAKKQHITEQDKQHAQIDALHEEYKAGEAPAVEYFFAEVLNHSAYPDSFPQGNTLSFNQTGGVLIVDLELPNHSAFPTVKEVKYIATRGEFQEVAVSDAWVKKAYDEALYQIALRTLHELYAADEAGVLKSIVFNGWVRSIDKATGVETHGCILSVQTSREEFLQINLGQVDPRACFRKLRGIASSKLIELTPVRPILTINREDHRFVPGYAVAETLDDRTNLAAMDWLDFENLIRELFEKEFSKNGGEVKIA